MGLAAALICVQSAARAEGLPDELQGLLGTHPQIQAKTASVASAEDGIGIARSGYLPTVKVDNSSGQQYDDSPIRTMMYGKPYMRGGDTSEITVTQHVFDGYSTDSAVGAAKVNRDISQADLRATRQNTLLDGATAYIAVVKATRLIQLARDNVRKVEDELNLEDERVEKGAGIAPDVLAAKQRLQVAKEMRVRFEGELETAAAKYIQVFGHAPDAANLAEPPIPTQALPATLDEALAEAQKNNPAIETAAKTVALTGQKRKSAEAGYYPTLDVVGHAGIDDGYNAMPGVRRDWSVMAVANWELFNGLKTRRQVAQASHDEIASKDNNLYSVRKVQELVRTSWSKLANARERMGLLENAAILAEDVWQSTKQRHAAGKATVRDMLDDESRIKEARIAYTQAYYEMVTATYEMLAAIGRMEAPVIADSANAGTETTGPLDGGMTKPADAQAPDTTVR